MGNRKAIINELHDAGLINDASAATLQSDRKTELTQVNGKGYNSLPGNLVVYRFSLAAGANGTSTTQLIPSSPPVIVNDAVIVLTGAGTAGSTVEVLRGGSAISDAVDVSAGSDQSVFRLGSLNYLSNVYAAANMSVRKASTGGDFPGAEVWVIAYVVGPIA